MKPRLNHARVHVHIHVDGVKRTHAEHKNWLTDVSIRSIICSARLKLVYLVQAEFLEDPPDT